MFKRTKSPAVEEQSAPTKPGGKGRPTPTRKEAEAAAKARARVPRDKRELQRQQRELRSESSRKIRQGMKAGDEKYFLPRDKGRVRRFIRDYVDARFSIVEMVIPLMIAGLVLGYTGQSALVQASSIVLLATVLFVITDMFVLRFRLRRELRRRFPDESLKGTTYYALTRSMQMKFMRLPKARVKIGQALPEDYDR
ncbi:MULTISPECIES: DUF3043 domain-containing protein [unclassified Nocardioides]|uniref:DUF3043 domain-containing protein n=1 Tax=unclassified Nocardioides TaxID=2615069 RepID=UPI0007030AFC|nr:MULTISPECIES: DUF3043 domain-containing protein [unclassified Nocardioides]KRC56774.1 hypothetical protein ASE19_02855 [Nocardioides sp. Root79]KRC76984.1 hypothetical protein ASE20_01725 [Nocardioides sp. Root240]